MAEIRKNKVKQKLNAGKVATVAMGYHNEDMVEFLGTLGFDGIWIETEHGPIDFKDIPHYTRAADLWGMTSIVRVHLNLHGQIYRTLDVGAQGICVPHVNTAGEARAVVEAGRFMPDGMRGMYTSRQGIGVPDYFKHANDETLLIVLIEDIVAIENIEEIVKVDGIDVFFVANGDLAQSMGYIGQARHPEVLKAADRAYDAILKAGRHAGALVTPDLAPEYIAKGIRLITTQWTGWVADGAAQFMKDVSAASK